MRFGIIAGVGRLRYEFVTTQMWPFLKDRRKIIYSSHVDNFPLLWLLTYVMLMVCFLFVQGLALVADRFFLVCTSYKWVSGLSRSILTNCGLLAACSGLRLVRISCSSTPLLTLIRLWSVMNWGSWLHYACACLGCHLIRFWFRHMFLVHSATNLWVPYRLVIQQTVML